MTASFADDLFGVLVAAEVFALATKRIPTVTNACRRYPLLAVLVLAVVGAHLKRRTL